MKPSWRRILGLLVVMSALVLAATGCGGGDGDEEAAATGATTHGQSQSATRPKIVLGTKNFTEQFVLGELYKQALEARGYRVTLKSNIGSTEIIDQALTSGKIDMYPEYTGTALTVVFGAEGSAASAEETYDQAKQRYEERGQTLLAMTPFSDSDAIAVLKSTAQKKQLRAIADLRKLGRFRLGGQPEFRTRTQGLPGLRKNYALTEIEFVPFAGISPYQALDQKKVDAAAIFSTDPPLATGKYTWLADAKALRTVGDLKKLGRFRLGGQPEFRTRTQGLPGLRRNYGLTNIEFVPFAGISPYEALDEKKVDAAAIFSTDPPLATGKYTVLEDTKAQFGFQNVAPVVDQELVDRLGQDFVDTVDAVSQKLTNEAIIAMNSAVAIDQRPAKEVAAEFLEANELA